ncbi:hypothetical protein BRE01_62760 [Brevibacillus reuszeri]|uniref:Uncharacterized protein n=1 Tax=Brevibacillus reuszeri TaxID=54915 RepID=A0ABQ0TXQ5_9BACL|nr:UPF0489 family protein [Brevibacillus reuszeri]GED72574.1 hypothetical protein BRE01_62760 [Brevibacillus reuszeri]
MKWEPNIYWKVKFNDKPIYLSKDHNWAFAAWEIEKINGNIKNESLLIHVDAHLDDVVDGVYVKGLKEIETYGDVLRVAQSYERGSEKRSEIMMEIANFIWAGIATGTIGETIFVSDDKMVPNNLESLSGFVDKEFYQFLPKDCRYKQVFRFIEVSDFIKRFNTHQLNHYKDGRSIILDLDLDYFNKSKQYLEADLKSEDDIRHELTALRDLCEWDLITVALSPEYCGGTKPCEKLLDAFLDVFELDMNEITNW